jgi:hypothetical protein
MTHQIGRNSLFVYALLTAVGTTGPHPPVPPNLGYNGKCQLYNLRAIHSALLVGEPH